MLIIDLVEDRFPSRHALARPEDFEEERRLMYVACTRARRNLDLYVPASIYSRAERGSLHVNQSPFVRELAPGLVQEWVEGFGGMLSRRGAASPFGENARRACCRAPKTRLRNVPPLTTASSGRKKARRAPPRISPAARGDAAAVDGPGAGNNALCYCRHRIFGRGKIIKHLPPDKVQVNFPGFGLKTILSEYLLMEN